MSLAKKALSLPQSKEKKEFIRAYFPQDFTKMYNEPITNLSISKGSVVRVKGGKVGEIIKYSSNKEITIKTEGTITGYSDSHIQVITKEDIIEVIK